MLSFQMKHNPFLPVAIITILCVSVGMAAEIPKTGQRTCFDQYGGVIDHEGSGQDGELQSGAVWPVPRFEDNGDGTVTDNLTGLMWMFDGGCLGAMSWPAAIQCSSQLNTPDEQPGAVCKLEAGCDDWFLPSIHQLETLFNGEEPSIPDWLASWGIINIQKNHYWTTTTSPNPYTAWGFHFDSGVSKLTAKVDHGFVLLARYGDSSLVTEYTGNKSSPEPSSAMSTLRFIDNGDGTVTDIETSLMWLKDNNCLPPSTWRDSLETIKDLNNNPAAYSCAAANHSYTDWALPNRNELRSLVDHTRDFPALPEHHPFVNVQPDNWGSTSVAQSPAQAFELLIGTGEIQITDKEELHHIWPVRPIGGRIPRERTSGKTREQVYKKVHSMFHSTGERINITWPAIRFTDRGDGTLIDNKSGLMWLKDSGCLGKRHWEAAFFSVERLNQSPEQVKCNEYTQAYEDWTLPNIELLTDLISDAKDEPAVWLQEQGAANVSARDYWTVTENPLNIYYAWALNLRQGIPHNYSKAFPLFIWPVRLPVNTGWVHPKPSIQINNQPEKLDIVQGEQFTLTAAISEIDNILEADFTIWYEAPDQSRWWLSANNAWVAENTVLYHGNLFPLNDYPVFKGRTTGMAPGLYTIHFDITIRMENIDLIPMLPTTFSSTYSLGIDRAIPDQANQLWNSREER
jgi:hypothetical protein